MAVYDMDDTLALLKQRLARFTSSTSLDTYGFGELVQAQQRLEHSPFKPWFLKTLKTDYAIGAAESTAVPTGWLGEVDDTKLILVNGTTQVVLLKQRYDDAYAEYPLTVDPATPIQYAVEGTNFFFFPTPDVATYTARMWYYLADTPPASGGAANNWTTHARDLLVAEAGFYISNFYLKHTDAATMFQAIIAVETNRLQNDTVWRETVNVSATPRDL